MPAKSKLTMVNFRWEPALIKRLDAHAERLARIHKGPTFSRTDAVKMLLEEALEKYEAKRR